MRKKESVQPAGIRLSLLRTVQHLLHIMIVENGPVPSAQGRIIAVIEGANALQAPGLPQKIVAPAASGKVCQHVLGVVFHLGAQVIPAVSADDQ